MIFAFDRKHRKIAIANLSRAFAGEKSAAEIQNIARKVFRNLVLILFEVGWYTRMREKDLQRHFTIRGVNHLHQAYARGKGILILTAHMGNWELLAAAVALTGYTTNILYRPLDNPTLDDFFNRSRARFGGKTIPNAKAMRKILKSLRREELVAMLMDQNVDWYEGVVADFFGHRAFTNKGMALLALKTGAPVLPVFVFREDHRFVIQFFPEVPLFRSGDKTRDVEVNTAAYNQAIETAIRRHPDQWFWVHQRWKTRPWQAWPREDA